MAQRYYEYESHPGTYVLEVEGDLTGGDPQSIESLSKTVDELGKREGLKRLIIMQSGNLEIDTAGLGQILSLCGPAYLKRKIKTSFVMPKGDETSEKRPFQFLYERCNISKIFPRYETLKEALEAK